MHRALVFALALLAAGPATLAEPAQEATTTEQLAGKLIIPSIDLDSASLITAVEFLQFYTRQLDSKPKTQLNISIPDKEVGMRTIDELKLRHVSFHYALTAFAEHTGTTVEFGEDTVVFKPADPKAKTAPSKPAWNSATATKARSITIPMIDFQGAWLAEALDYFRLRARELDPEFEPTRKGLNIRVVGKDLGRKEIHSLQLRNASLHQAMAIIAEMTNTTVAFEDEAVVFRPADANAKPPKFFQMPTPTLAKARQIEIPKIDYERTLLGEGVDYLSLRSREIDATEINPRDRGINIVILTKDLAKKKIKKLKLSDVSLQAALTAMAEATDSTVQFREQTIVFIPKPATK